MVLYDLIQIKPALDRLMQKSFNSFSVIRQLGQLSQAVDQEIKFYQEQEGNIVKDCGVFDDQGNVVFEKPGYVKMKEGLDPEEVQNRILDLRSVDVGDKIKKITISSKDIKNQADFITPADLVILMPIIDFVD